MSRIETDPRDDANIYETPEGDVLPAYEGINSIRKYPKEVMPHLPGTVAEQTPPPPEPESTTKKHKEVPDLPTGPVPVGHEPFIELDEETRKLGLEQIEKIRTQRQQRKAS